MSDANILITTIVMCCIAFIPLMLVVGVVGYIKRPKNRRPR